MKRLGTILPFTLLAVLLMVTASYALPSCCQTGDSGNTSTVTSFWSNLTSGLRAPAAPKPARSYRPELRQATAPAQPISVTPSTKVRSSAKRTPVPNRSVSSLPSCCAAGGTGYQQSVSRTGILPVRRYYPSYGDVRPQATLGTISFYGGCCGASAYPSRSTPANLPSCCSTEGGSYAGYQGAPVSASSLPSCCSTSGGSYASQYRAAPAASPSSVPPCCQASKGTSAGYNAIRSRQNARAVPAVATRKSGNGYYWKTVAGSGPFGKPGYFPAVRGLW